jgi:DnaK suppressor protein
MDPERAHELLARERARIERALAARLPADVGELSNGDDEQADQASELYQEEFDEGLVADLRAELEAVERAEARLAAGTYGLSVESGLPIPDERLEAIPTAELTLEEQTRRGPD